MKRRDRIHQGTPIDQLEADIAEVVDHDVPHGPYDLPRGRRVDDASTHGPYDVPRRRPR